jgi:multimeric flavodoxin WrbA
MRVLGLSCSLRNARFGAGSEALIRSIQELSNESDLSDFLEKQTKLRVDDFVAAGRDQNLGFDKIYAKLKTLKGDRGLSNSEAALVAGLWGAHKEGAEIRHLGLSAFFPMAGKGKSLDLLRASILEADALLVSGPVYFGDRGSLAQELFEFLYSDEACAEHIRDKLYAGIAVGAKRNGGQETTLVYQIVDATNLNMLAVGNDGETTSQYGGTAVAGDVGTLFKDNYGIETSIGTGSRLAKVGKLLHASQGRILKEKANIQIWWVQDTEDRRGYGRIVRLAGDMMAHNASVNVEVVDLTRDETWRCIACDVCPTSVAAPEEYRCIIGSPKDTFVRRHQTFIRADGILIGAYSPIDRSRVHSVYQRFMERTRYLRRDDYVLGDKMVAPLVISELDSNQNLHIRMLTSLIRHQTVLHHPLIGIESKGEILNYGTLQKHAHSFSNAVVRLTTGTLAKSTQAFQGMSYSPVGYVISKKQREEDELSGAIRQSQDARQRILAEEQRMRLK